MPMLPPKRPTGFYERVLLEWRMIGEKYHLTDTEMITLGGQHLGLAVAAANFTPDGQQALLDHAVNVVRTSYVGRIAIKNGFGHPAFDK